MSTFHRLLIDLFQNFGVFRGAFIQLRLAVWVEHVKIRFCQNLGGILIGRHSLVVLLCVWRYDWHDHFLDFYTGGRVLVHFPLRFHLMVEGRRVELAESLIRGRCSLRLVLVCGDLIF